MAVSGENSRCPPDTRSMPWSGLAAAAPGRWESASAPDERAPTSPLDYAVMIPASSFPVGWVRFSAAHDGYTFNTLMPGRDASGEVHAEPEQAVPAWVGAHRLRKIHPIPESVTGDMMAAAPEMLGLLKKVQALIDAGIDVALDGVYLEQVIAKAEGRD
jgi:hypothetical protein